MILELKNTLISKLIFLLSMLFLMFFLIGKSVNIYVYPITGAIFEILWLPFIAIGVVGPIISLVNWIKQKFITRSFYLYALIIFLLSYFLIIIF